MVSKRRTGSAPCDADAAVNRMNLTADDLAIEIEKLIKKKKISTKSIK